MFEAFKLKAHQVEQQEEILRSQIGELDKLTRKKFYTLYSTLLKDPDTYAVLNFFFLTGLHHFYLGRTQAGLLYSCTMGLCYWGIIYDLTRMQSLVDEANQALGNSPGQARVRTQSPAAPTRVSAPPMDSTPSGPRSAIDSGNLSTGRASWFSRSICGE